MADPVLTAHATALAKTLAERRGTTMTEAIIAALEAEIARDHSQVAEPDEFDALADELLASARPRGRAMTRDETDAMWGAF